LRRQGLVRRQHQARALHARDDIGDRVSLARTGHAQQDLMGEAVLQVLDHAFDRGRLIAGRRPVGLDRERRVAAPLEAHDLFGNRLGLDFGDFAGFRHATMMLPVVPLFQVSAAGNGQQ
jgi:hypothetical protein